MENVIITAAITGSRISREQTPHIPITPDEITQSAIEAWEAGAAMVHLHMRDPKTHMGTPDVSLFRPVVETLRNDTDLILNLTTSGVPGLNFQTEERLAPLELKPEMASFDAGSINMGGDVFINKADFLEIAAKRMIELGVKPELEIFDLGMIIHCLRMRDQGFLKAPFHFQLVLGTPHGSPATPRILSHMLDLLPENSTWSIIGIGRAHLPMAMLGLILDGHIRVGLEDNIYYKRGELATSNAQLVERIVRIANEYGRDVATPDEARMILGLRI